MEWTTGLEWYIFGFYTFLIGLIDSQWLKVVLGDSIITRWLIVMRISQLRYVSRQNLYEEK